MQEHLGLLTGHKLEGLRTAKNAESKGVTGAPPQFLAAEAARIEPDAVIRDKISVRALIRELLDAPMHHHAQP